MRLIRASSIDRPDELAFKDFPVSQLPPYAILSHTWRNDEVIWADIQRGTATQKPSFDKIRHCCLQALKDGLEWVWIDSCCIDKSSSAELSEAINSMYNWYQQADICYAHLEGVSAAVDVTKVTSVGGGGGEFARCRWFSRGWTLQELLAPTEMAFYSEDWVKVGDKAAIHRPLSIITGIDEDILTGARAPESASIAKRMSWAAYRETTRPEDVAYCLMGMFGVNMPMLYGEGSRAFLRLQEEIMKQSDDQSLFAWANLDASVESYHGLLARSPRDFAHSHGIMPYQDWEPRPPYQLTNRGLRIDLPLTARELEESGDGVFIAALDCPAPPDYEDGWFLAIYLRKLSTVGEQQYSRIRVSQFAKVQERGRRQTIYVKQNPAIDAAAADVMFLHHVFQLRAGPSTSVYRTVDVIVDNDSAKPKVISSSRADVRGWVPSPKRVSFVAPKVPSRLAGAIMLERVDGRGRVLVLLGSSSNGIKVAYNAAELPPAPRHEDDAVEQSGEYSFEALQKVFRPSEVVKLDYNELRVSVDTVIHGSSKYFLIDLHLEDTGMPDGFDEIVVDAAKSIYDKAVGRENKTEASRQDKAIVPAKKSSSLWRRLVS